MIITQKKPIEELMAMLEGVTKVALVGCGNCATACQTGGQPEMQAMTEYLATQGIEVVGTVYPDECCHKLLVKRDLKAIKDTGYTYYYDGTSWILVLINTTRYLTAAEAREILEA